VKRKKDKELEKGKEKKERKKPIKKLTVTLLYPFKAIIVTKVIIKNRNRHQCW